MSLWTGIHLPYVVINLSIRPSNVGQLKGKGHVAQHESIWANERAAAIIIKLALHVGNDEIHATSSLPSEKNCPRYPLHMSLGGSRACLNA